MLHEAIFALVVLGAGLIVWAALHDVVARTVPNAVSGAVAVAGLLVQVLAGTPGSGLAAAALVFVVAAIGWRFGLMGGGDVKLLGAAALLVPAWSVPTLIAAMGLSGGVLALLYLCARNRMPRPGWPLPFRSPLLPRLRVVEQWRLRRGGPLPYAVAIAFGAIFALSKGGWS